MCKNAAHLEGCGSLRFQALKPANGWRRDLLQLDGQPFALLAPAQERRREPLTSALYLEQVAISGRAVVRCTAGPQGEQRGLEPKGLDVGGNLREVASQPVGAHGEHSPCRPAKA